jgi:FixJ family two-component response regulator
MKITVFGTTEELESVKRAAEEIPMLQYRKLLWENAQDYDALMRGGADADLCVITMEGAEGMEGAMLLRHVRPECPVIWFSGDPAFGAQARRLQCAWFGEKPITHAAMTQAMTNAIQR